MLSIFKKTTAVFGISIPALWMNREILAETYTEVLAKATENTRMDVLNGLRVEQSSYDRNGEIGQSQWSSEEELFLGVMDGYGGDKCVNFISNQLIGAVRNMLYHLHQSQNKLIHVNPKIQEAAEKGWDDYRVKNGMTDETWRRLRGLFDLKLAIPRAMEKGFLLTDSMFVSDAERRNEISDVYCGSTALLTYLFGHNLYVANAGDCRAVLGRVNEGKIMSVPLSHDHTATNEEEKIRLSHPNDTRVVENGLIKGISPRSRAFGDVRMKYQGTLTPEQESYLAPWEPPYISAQPEIYVKSLNEDDKFVIMATKGLWSLVSNQEAVEIVDDCVRNQKENCALQLVETFLKKVGYSSDPNQAHNVAVSIIHMDIASKESHDHLPQQSMKYYSEEFSLALEFFQNQGKRKNFSQ